MCAKHTCWGFLNNEIGNIYEYVKNYNILNIQNILKYV